MSGGYRKSFCFTGPASNVHSLFHGVVLSKSGEESGNVHIDVIIKMAVPSVQEKKKLKASIIIACDLTSITNILFISIAT
jgi:hypothetical protein